MNHQPTRRALVLSPAAGSMTREVLQRLHREFSDHAVFALRPGLDLVAALAEDAVVVAAGGDGTVGWVGRSLLDSGRHLAILPLGTFNNFARSLGIPDDLGAAIEVARHGRPRPVTVGRVDGRPFLEVAAIGLVGEGIQLGQAIKELHFGALGEHLGQLLTAQRFGYRLTGDIEQEGTAFSIVFANTPSTGAGVGVAEDTPLEPYLELSLHAGENRRDLVGDLLSSTLLHRHQADLPTLRFRRIRVETTPAEPVLAAEAVARVYADDVELGTTPVTVEADIDALSVMVPSHPGQLGSASR